MLDLIYNPFVILGLFVVTLVIGGYARMKWFNKSQKKGG